MISLLRWGKQHRRVCHKHDNQGSIALQNKIDDMTTIVYKMVPLRGNFQAKWHPKDAVVIGNYRDTLQHKTHLLHRTGLLTGYLTSNLVV